MAEGLQTVGNRGPAAQLQKLYSLKCTIQRQRLLQQLAQVQHTTLEQLALPKEYKRISKESSSSCTTQSRYRGSSSSGDRGTWRC